MRCSATILCLLAALTGTPLRQAEAADDLSRALAKLCEPAHIETPDGGVGDDSGEGTLRPADHVPTSHDREPGDRAFVSLPHLLTPSQVAPHVALRWQERAAWPPNPSIRGRAWLGVYLF
jgi:hypothetical protein